MRALRAVDLQGLAALRHEKLDWLTLITCQDYDAQEASYRRLVLRAVRVAAERTWRSQGAQGLADFCAIFTRLG